MNYWDPQVQKTEEAVAYMETELTYTTNPMGLKMAIGAGQDIVVVDVRKEEDFKKGHIPGAINLPFDKWDGFLGCQTHFPGLRKDAIQVVYCYQLLCNLAQKAALKFASLGYPIKELKGGYDSWKNAQFPIES